LQKEGIVWWCNVKTRKKVALLILIANANFRYWKPKQEVKIVYYCSVSDVYLKYKCVHTSLKECNQKFKLVRMEEK
jgi:hypothetical protein